MMRRGSLRWVRQVLAQKGTAKAFAVVLCVSLVVPPQFGVAAELAYTGFTNINNLGILIQQLTKPPCSGQKWTCSQLNNCPSDCQVGKLVRTETHCSQVGNYCCLYILNIYECKCANTGRSCGNAGISIVFWWAEGRCATGSPTPTCVY
ncbi:hypothetical protein HRbin15_02158 [bacterium HR15]|nr:hypothetical protein HRbin15_02158 [bacterium HR15]